jgi:rhodanese-related sulfurtransferase
MRISKKITAIMWFIFSLLFSHGLAISATDQSIKTISRVKSFALSPTSIQDLLRKDEKIILVDVRSSDEFQKVKIPGSINIPLFTLKTKEFLKPKSLVLLNNGLGYRALELECKKLKNIGFRSVRILYGGLNYWRDLKGPLEGDFFDINKISYISPAEYFMDKNYDDWLVIDISEAASKKEKELIPNTVNMSSTDNDDKFVMKLSAIITKQEDLLPQYVLIVSDDDKKYDNISNMIKNNPDLLNIFYLRGGLADYADYLEKQKAIPPSNKKTVKKCASCP